MAVNKPPGMIVHPTYKNTSGTLVNALLAHRVLPTTPGVITRLDKNTSGLVLIALTSQVHMHAQRDAHAGLTKKEYLAVVYGAPAGASGVITLPLARSSEDRRRVVVSDDGAAAETRYEVVGCAGELSLVRCELITGRTHQIRVHLAAIGWPIAGDPTYGRPHPAIDRQALHAWRIALPHPLTREPLSVTAPIPADMRALMPCEV